MKRNSPASILRLHGSYFKFNLAAGMAYRSSFFTQVFAMVINNASFIVFWKVLYSLETDMGGWAFADVMLLWALVAIIYGLGEVFFGNIPWMSRMIIQGELDVYLTQPKPVALHAAGSRMAVAGWGDVLYGLVVYFLTQPVSPGHFGLFLGFTAVGTLTMAAARLAWHSLGLWLGNAEGVAAALDEMMLSMNLYPPSLFPNEVRLVLTVAVPSALVAWLPAEILRETNLPRLLTLLVASAAVVAAALGIFTLGLRRYASGNRMGARV